MGVTFLHIFVQNLDKIIATYPNKYAEFFYP